MIFVNTIHNTIPKPPNLIGDNSAVLDWLIGIIILNAVSVAYSGFLEYTQ